MASRGTTQKAVVNLDSKEVDFFVDQFEKAWKEGDVIDLQRHTIYEP